MKQLAKSVEETLFQHTARFAKRGWELFLNLKFVPIKFLLSYLENINLDDFLMCVSAIFICLPVATNRLYYFH